MISIQQSNQASEGGLEYTEAVNKTSCQDQLLNVVAFCQKVFFNHYDLAIRSKVLLSFKSHYEQIVANVDYHLLENVLNIIVKYLIRNKEASQVKLEMNIDIKDAECNCIPLQINVYSDVHFKHDVENSTAVTEIKELLNHYQGKFSYQNVNNSGYCFKFGFPLKGKYKLDKQSPLIREMDGAIEKIFTTPSPVDKAVVEKEFSTEDHPTILIVDDEDDVIQYLSSALEQRYKILTSIRGKEGVELTIKHKPDLVICDILMPGLDGLEFCKTIKENPETNHIPLILITGWLSEYAQLKGYDYGADDFIIKPFNVELLLRRIDNLINNRKKVKAKFVKDHLIGENYKFENKCEQDFIEKASDIVEKNMSDPSFDIDQFAHKMEMSHTPLYNKVKKLTGHSPLAFIRSIRLKHAVAYLKQQKFTISEVAFMVGYNTPSYFAKCFKNQYGYTPKVFLNNQK